MDSFEKIKKLEKKRERARSKIQNRSTVAQTSQVKEVRKRCFERGFTTGDTGEGLSMLLEYIEIEYLGSI